MICDLEVLDPTGHVTLQWDPDDPESVARAEAEFKRLQDAGFAFFTSSSPDADQVEALDDDLRARGALDARLVVKREPVVEQVQEFPRRRRRTVAVAPMQGG
jgi:hypothetical protein